MESVCDVFKSLLTKGIKILLYSNTVYSSLQFLSSTKLSINQRSLTMDCFSFTDDPEVSFWSGLLLHSRMQVQ